MINIKEITTNYPYFLQKQMGKELHCSDSTTKRYRSDIKMDSPRKRNNRKQTLSHLY